jgi:phosphoglycerate dehydrogenase-like enzyme
MTFFPDPAAQRLKLMPGDLQMQAKEADKVYVHITSEPDDKIRQEFLQLLNSKIEVTWGSRIDPQNGYEILIAGRPSTSDLDQMPGLKSVIVPFAGIPLATRDLIRDHPQIALHNLHHNATATAEIGLALLLSAAKFIVPFDQKLRQGNWTPRYEPSPAILLHGKSILILGFGSIGQIIGHVCLALGMQVSAIRRSLNSPIVESSGVQLFPPSFLPAILPKTNVLMVCLPLTSETENLIDASALELLPGGSILINIGRGLIVSESALYDNLKNGHLAAAGLDVWYQYPDSVESRSKTNPSHLPFDQFDNLVLSPHRGGATRDTEHLRYLELARLLNLRAEGNPMPNRVNLDHGY